jgi:cytochrome c biogenesis protein CcmG/thiol:disulfide interchange protein DsbE
VVTTGTNTEASPAPPSEGGGPPPTDQSAPTPPRGPRRLRALLIGCVIAAALAVFLFVGLGHQGHGSSGPKVSIGSQAPGFSLPPLTGTVPVDLDALGKNTHHPVVLNFFASWCTPCEKESPLLAKVAAAELTRGAPVRFVGVDVNDPPANALSFLKRTGITYAVGVDQTFRVTSGLYGLDGLPQTFFIDTNGRVLGHTIGAVDAAGLRSWVKKLDRAAA